MSLVPMDTTNGGQEDLIARDITIRIITEILGNELCNTDSTTALGVAARAALTLTTLATNLGLGSSLPCPAWYTGISTGMTSRGRSEGEGRNGVTSTAGAGPPILPSPGPSLRRGWPAKRPDPPGRPAGAVPGAGLRAAIRSAAAARPAVTGSCHPSAGAGRAFLLRVPVSIRETACIGCKVARAFLRSSSRHRPAPSPQGGGRSRGGGRRAGRLEGCPHRRQKPHL